ncbi:DNA-binding MurR/RpiR family transcriptional regulator [Virgibacillus natechei]|uniref:DNA-binding MurR/RpiR family transcriptional regulator n=1 Tax=Virgibacillus natechei TaxID=1216297 RepID=A0ABS4IKZ4_9BACI|nr:MurR/RpiR family transcriptional regulator [Virgibacillus natechei]MBP1971543.1 DNA-binding MurR/RpiR family transcriptional regulator [Virgibacillus natechei]UZD11987.1 MurR/RpiR family transcriptional regulator [Virgibacillus natechei]
MSHTGGLVILKEMVSSLPPSERKIADYILNNPEESILLTALSLGEKSQTSSAAVIRLCKSLGLSGFQELKIRVAGDLRVESVDDHRDIEPNEEYRSIIDKVTSNTIQTVKETVDIMSEQNLEKAVSALTNAKSIIFIGFGASYIAARDAEQKFMRINKNVFSFSDVHMAATSIANKGPGDVVVGISFSGNTQEAAKLLELAHNKNTTTISITKYGNSLVSPFSDIQLHTSAAKEATFRSGATSSRIAQLHVIDILFMSLASIEYDETIMHLDKTRDAIAFLADRKA